MPSGSASTSSGGDSGSGSGAAPVARRHLDNKHSFITDTVAADFPPDYGYQLTTSCFRRKPLNNINNFKNWFEQYHLTTTRKGFVVIETLFGTTHQCDTCAI